MKLDNALERALERDLQLNVPYVKGQMLTVKNCWHFSTNGNDVDAIYYNNRDFIDGMNRIYVIGRLFNVVILAFVLMDNHIHFVLYGEFDECNRFIHEYMRRTSMYISSKHGEKHKLENVSIDYQVVDTQSYLKTVICYVIKNPPVAGIRNNSYDYPWSSGPLYFRTSGTWASPIWTAKGFLKSISSIIPGREKRDEYFHTHSAIPDNVMISGDIVFPGEYIAFETVEKLFVTQKSFNYHLCKTKEDDVDLIHSNISFLSIPDQEMRQHKNELLEAMFGLKTVKNLDTSQRIALARTLKSKYNCSLKQLAGLCGINIEDLKRILGYTGKVMK